MYPKPDEPMKPSPTATRTMTMTVRIEYSPARLSADEVVCEALDRLADGAGLLGVGWEAMSGHAWGGDIRFRA